VGVGVIAGYGIYSVQFTLSCAGLETFPENVSSDLVQRITDAAEQPTVELAAISGTFNMAHPDPGSSGFFGGLAFSTRLMLPVSLER